MSTGQVQIFSNQTSTFNHPNDYKTKFRVNAFEFCYAPDWILESKMFKLLTKDNKIKVINTKSDVAQIENVGSIKAEKINNTLNDVENANNKSNANENVNISDAELQSYSEKTARELYDLCMSKGINVESKKPKDYYLKKLLG